MSGHQISGLEIDLWFGPIKVTFNKVSLNIEDASKAVMKNGKPGGFVRGAVSASGEAEIDSEDLTLIMAAAAAKGSFQALGTPDVVITAATSSNGLNIIAHDCLFKIAKLLDAEGNGGEAITHTLPFEVTGEDFLTINGVSYAEGGKGLLGLF